MTEKDEILKNYTNLVDNINKLHYLTIYLKWIIDNTIDNDVDSDEFIYLYRKIEELSIIFGIQNDTVFRFKNEVNKMLSNLEVNEELDLTKYTEQIKNQILEIHKNKKA